MAIRICKQMIDALTCTPSQRTQNASSISFFFFLSIYSPERSDFLQHLLYIFCLLIATIHLFILQNQRLSSLYLIQKGKVRLTYRPELLSPNACSLLSTLFDQGCHFQEDGEHIVEISEGSHFGQWTLLDEHISSLTAVSVGEVVCSVFTKENFDLIVGPLTKAQNNHRKYVFNKIKILKLFYLVYMHCIMASRSKDFQDSLKEVEPNSAAGTYNIQFSDLVSHH